MPIANFDTSIGVCAIEWSANGVLRLHLPDRKRRNTKTLDPPAATRKVIKQVQRHLDGKLSRFEAVILDLEHVTPFRCKVYEALRATKPGETLSYGDLAKRAGSPKAARAVGGAMANNPVPIIVPCHRVLGADGKPGGFSAYGGTVTKAKLLEIEGVSLFGGTSTLPYDQHQALRDLKRADKRLAKWIDRIPFSLRLRESKATFPGLAESIVYQQLSGKAAATIFSRLLASFPGRRVLQPDDIVGASDKLLRAAGLSRAKAAAINDLAQKTLASEVPSRAKLRRMDDDAIIEALTRVRGIGRWTVEMLLMFQLGRPDVLPSNDLGVRKGFARMMGQDELPTPKALLAYGERWRPWRSVASWYMWRVLEH
jgi:methylated-DNA-[protein]-cysteine S-methyltransferase